MKKYWCREYPDEGYLICETLEEARKIMRCDKCDSAPLCEGPDGSKLSEKDRLNPWRAN